MKIFDYDKWFEDASEPEIIIVIVIITIFNMFLIAFLSFYLPEIFWCLLFVPFWYIRKLIRDGYLFPGLLESKDDGEDS